jgi:hypothetical protein
VMHRRYPLQSDYIYLGIEIESGDDSLGFLARAGHVKLKLMPERRRRRGSLSEALGHPMSLLSLLGRSVT